MHEVTGMKQMPHFMILNTLNMLSIIKYSKEIEIKTEINKLNWGSCKGGLVF